MVNHYIPTTRKPTKCDYCGNKRIHKYLNWDDPTKLTKTVKAICKKCYDKRSKETWETIT